MINLTSFILLVSLLQISDGKNDECFCFTSGENFSIQYQSLLKDIHLAEITLPTVSTWLSCKTMRSYNLVPHYAVYDYINHNCDRYNYQEQACINAKMNEEIYLEQIKYAVDAMALQCQCK
jgi:hypothetical protein